MPVYCIFNTQITNKCNNINYRKKKKKQRKKSTINTSQVRYANVKQGILISCAQHHECSIFACSRKQCTQEQSEIGYWIDLIHSRLSRTLSWDGWNHKTWHCRERQREERERDTLLELGTGIDCQSTELVCGQPDIFSHVSDVKVDKTSLCMGKLAIRTGRKGTRHHMYLASRGATVTPKRLTCSWLKISESCLGG